MHNHPQQPTHYQPTAQPMQQGTPQPGGASLGQPTAGQPVASSDQQAKYQQVLSISQQLYQRNPDWVTFFREVLGIDGLARRTFPTFEELTAFERSPEFSEIQKLVVRLRENKATADSESEPTRVITVRLPKSMHEYLRTEAHDLRTSMNKLCISKLLQVIEQDLIPAEKTAPPKRRQQPQPQQLRQPQNPLTSSTATQGVDSPFKNHF